MNEQRLVTMILVTLLMAGIAGLATVYFSSKSRNQSESVATVALKEKIQVSRKIQMGPLPPPDPTSPNASQDPAADLPGKTNEKQTPKPFPKVTPKESENTHMVEVAPSPASTITPGPVGDLKVRPEKIVSTASHDTGPLHETIEETSNANGTFYSAQQVRQGTITGSRGSQGDLADYFKVKAEGNSMTLNIISSDEKTEHNFMLDVFDPSLQPVKASKKRAGSGIIIQVKQGKTYYIRVGLGGAPIKDSTYRLHIRFIR